MRGFFNSFITILSRNSARGIVPELISAVTPETWEKIAIWGRKSGFLDIQLQNTAREIARKMKKAKKPTASVIERASAILGTVREHNLELLGQ